MKTLRATTYLPVHEKLIASVSRGFEILTGDVKLEIRNFIEQNQNNDGGFSDRAGKSDWYYSLFGLWLSKALKMDICIDKLKIYYEKANPNILNNEIDKAAYQMIGLELSHYIPNIKFRLNDFFSLFRLTEWVYSFFVKMMLYDALGYTKKWYLQPAGIFSSFLKDNNNLPSSILSAFIVMKNRLGKRTNSLQDILVKKYYTGQGFKTFKNVANADMLSTSVSLFALKESNFDLRIISANCLQFIESNYQNGAFLSGNGDMESDLEYTFYGLSALGILC